MQLLATVALMLVAVISVSSFNIQRFSVQPIHLRSSKQNARSSPFTHSSSTTTPPFLPPSSSSLRSTLADQQAKKPPSLKPYIEKLISKTPLTSTDAEKAFTQILQGADPIQVGALLMLLRMKGETSQEIAGMVRAMNGACNNVNIPGKLLDIVGTGGDGADTINISTLSAVVAAAAGCVVAKAGNRSVSSACGSADVLEALGVKVDLSPKQTEKCVADVGIAFMFAPVNHPSMKHVAPVRKSLGVRSCFNILGPMTNAASAQHAVIGVFEEGLQDLMADTLMEVGRIEHAVVIHGVGLDEISPLGPASILEIKNVASVGEVKKYEKKKFVLDPLEFGIPRCTLLDLKGGEPEMNKLEFIKALQPGAHSDAKRDSICLNAGMGIYVYGGVKTIKEGVELARKTLESGMGFELLERWISCSNQL